MTTCNRDRSTTFRSLRWASLDPPTLRFAPLAWLKLQYLCHVGRTEVGGFGISADHDMLYVEGFQTLLQGATAASIEFSDNAVADHFDRYADQQVPPARCGRIWIHTHPGVSATPSNVDEATFARVFGPSDWACMFILSRTGQTYARLRFSAGPGGEMIVPVAVDWSAWPGLLGGQATVLPQLIEQWRNEYDRHIFDLTAMERERVRDGVDATDDFGLQDGGRTDLDAGWEFATSGLPDLDERLGMHGDDLPIGMFDDGSFEFDSSFAKEVCLDA